MSHSPMHRRTFLRGTGAAMALPLLDAMASKAAWAKAAGETSHPVRMAFVFFPNGAIMPEWKPTGSGSDWQLSPTLLPLKAVKEKLTIISALGHENGRGGKDGAGDHARSAATFLTAARPLKSSTKIYLGTSVDQVAAGQLVGKTKLPSLELGISPSRNAGGCDSGYSCAYQSNISWRNETQPMPKEINPRMAFERLFGNGEDPKVREERNFWRRSILDSVSQDTQRVLKNVGRQDQLKLEEYLASVREIELRIEQTEREDEASRPQINLPDGRPESFEEHAKLMMDLMVLGFQTDTTRVATFMLDNEGSNRAYAAVEVKDGHHELSHHRNDEAKVAKIKRIDQHLVSQYAYLLEKMDSIREEDGTLLDHSMVLYGSGISDGNRHRHEDLPIILAGGAGGKIKTNRLLNPPEPTPMANLFLGMLDCMGTPAESLGDSTGKLNLA
jgi:hypothetical protein